MFCEKCGKEIPNGSAMCPECGAATDYSDYETVNSGQYANGQTKICKHCGAQIPSDSRFCPECRGVQEDVGKSSNASNTVKMSNMNNKVQNVIQLTPEEQKKIKKRNKIIAFSFLGVIALCLVIGLLTTIIKPKINLNNYITISFEGYDTAGTASVEIKTDKLIKDYGSKISAKINSKSKFSKGAINYESAIRSFLTDCVEWSIDKSDGLSNGDEVVLTWKCRNDLALKEYGCKLKYETIKLKVSKLKKAETFDPFEGVEVVFSGISPNGEASINRDSSDGEEYYDNDSDFYYDFDRDSELSNGDTVTLRVSAGGDDFVSYCLENYGKIPSATTKEYKVEGLNAYVTSISQIAGDGLTNMQNQANDVFKAYVAQEWDDKEESLSDFKYCGSYLLNMKDAEDSWGDINKLYLVYKVSVKYDFNDKKEKVKYKETRDFYWYIEYKNILVNPSGELTVDVSNYETPYDSVKIDTGIEYGWDTLYWEYRGYESLDALYKNVVASSAAEYNSEEKMEDDATD